ncbi:hypothetical protein BAURA63_03867 [Brevibacterium aurantiacum]|uniref:Uncharacterized protein n=2 Tax=Brevibacterium aurantiacum TaxID=273384 RepID=A0A2H1KWW6_BREAU|nr:hypothetical protein BAURA63_03867 [Brevibacterium aurantiacum]
MRSRDLGPWPCSVMCEDSLGRLELLDPFAEAGEEELAPVVDVPQLVEAADEEVLHPQEDGTIDVPR